MQKFNKGDLVRVAKDLGPTMSHFTSDCDAIVIGSYFDQIGHGKTDIYQIYIKGRGESAWYYESQLSLIELNRSDMLATWEAEAKADHKQKSGLDWIFENGKEVLEKGYGSSIEALAKCLGIDNMWGSRGEGFTWYANAAKVMEIAAPYLVAGDKDGYLTMISEAKKS